MKSYKKWININIKNLKNKTILINGVTGGIGKATVYYLASLNNSLIFLVRNLKEAEKLKNEIIKTYNVNVDIIFFDYLDKNSLNNCLINLKTNKKIDIFMNVSGIYHQKEEYIGDIEKTFIVNYFAPSYFISSLFKLFPDLKVIDVSSVTYQIKKIKNINYLANKESFINYLKTIKNKTIRYGLSKRFLMQYLLYLKINENKNIVFVHPGVSKTNLFDKKNNAYGKWFYYFVPSLMNLIFMKPSKACLSLLKGAEIDNINKNFWVGPHGFLNFWGYPKIYKLRKDLMNKEIIEKIYSLTNEINDLWKIK